MSGHDTERRAAIPAADWLRLITQESPSVIVIGLTVHGAVQFVTTMKQAGATAVLTKETAVDQLHRIIHQTWEAQPAWPPALELPKEADSTSCRAAIHDGGARSASSLN